MPSPCSCDNCGRKMAKAKRVHQGTRFCATCYAREFRRRPCPGCGNLARLPIKDDGSVCHVCVRSRPCVRCGRSGLKLGKLSPYGPVCNACSAYFRPERPCARCGALSRRLSHVKRQGTDAQVCPKCARSDFGTCSACRRHRLLVTDEPRKLCKSCTDLGEIPCQQCGKPMPAGRRTVCEPCYWRNTLYKRIVMDQAAFHTSTMASQFGEFGSWLLETVGSNKAAITLHRYLPFFIAIEREWDHIPAYTNLLQCFGAEGLRRVRLPMRWLEQTRGIVVDADAREAFSEWRRIEAVLNFLNGRPRTIALASAYLGKLRDRLEQGRTSVRSIRLALRPAIALLCSLDAYTELPDQASVDRYLAGSPGQRAALVGFLIFLNLELGSNLVASADSTKAWRLRPRRLEAKLHALTQAPETVPIEEWLSTALALVHRLPRAILRKAVWQDMEHRSVPGMQVTLESKSYWVPTPECYTLLNPLSQAT